MKSNYTHIENAAKKAFKNIQNNPEYEFEVSELAGYISCGVAESFYKQAFYAGYNYRKALTYRTMFNNMNRKDKANLMIESINYFIQEDKNV